MRPTLQPASKYAIYEEFANGGMASVHFGRLIGDLGFARTIAIKRLHAQFAKDDAFLAMFLDESRLAARIHHPNVVSTIDAATVGGETFLVLEYVHGDSVARLLRAGGLLGSRCPPSVAASIVCGALHGLHAAHEAKTEDGAPLGIIHRDVSPQNIIVGTDGVARVLDFGVAKATGRMQETREGEVKGKLRYMSPEQLQGRSLDRRADIYSAGVVLWEILTGTHLIKADNEGAIVTAILSLKPPAPSSVVPGIPGALDTVVLTALSREPSRRFSTARKMALAIEAAINVAGPVTVGEWVEEIAGTDLARRAAVIAEIEAGKMPRDSGSITARSGVRVVPIEGQTQVSTIVMSSPPMAMATSRKRTGRYVAGAMLLVAALATTGIVVRRHRASRSAGISASRDATAALATPAPSPSPPAVDDAGAEAQGSGAPTASPARAGAAASSAASSASSANVAPTQARAAARPAGRSPAPATKTAPSARSSRPEPEPNPVGFTADRHN